MRSLLQRTGFLSTRVGRRTLVSFLLAGLLPAALVAITGVVLIRKALMSQAESALLQHSKLGSLAILEKLSVLASNPDSLPGDTLLTLGQLRPLSREAVIRARLEGDESTIVIRYDSVTRRQLPTLFFAVGEGMVRRRTLTTSTMWGSLDELFDHDGDGYCVFEVDTWRELHCSPSVKKAKLEAAVLTLGKNSDVATLIRGGDWLLASRDAFLQHAFDTPSWRLVSVRSRATVLAPVTVAQRQLLLLLVMAVVVAFTLGHMQIRRTTEPLHALQVATAKVQRGEFDTDIPVTSSDEYGQLARAFNVMAGEIGHKISLLSALDSVDEISLTQREELAIAEQSLRALQRLHPAEQLSLALLETPETSTLRIYRLDAGSATVHAYRGTLSPADRCRLEESGQSLLRGERLPSVRRPGVGGEPPFSRDENRAGISLIEPLRHNERLLGALLIDNPVDDGRMEEIAVTAHRMAARVSLGISNVSLIEQLAAISKGTLHALALAIDANSNWTAGHSERVTTVSILIGRELQLSEAELECLYRGGLMHDVGKIGIPAEILDKPGRLTEDELDIIQQHPVIGETILKSVSAFSDILGIVRHHHEKMDGSGYPDQLRGEEIPFLARLVAVADVFDALVSDRPYRKSFSQSAAVEMIHQGVDSHFDARVVHALMALYTRGALGPDDFLPSKPLASYITPLVKI